MTMAGSRLMGESNLRPLQLIVKRNRLRRLMRDGCIGWAQQIESELERAEDYAAWLSMFALEHRYIVRKDALPDSSIESMVLLYFVNVGAATLPVVVLFYGREALGILAPK
ncbi:MAG: hypothetical protein OXU62_11355 [Gammaproteobacteria bacterium]|nr:hypothetical protein [Gammaproteobacteria bacterium]